MTEEIKSGIKSVHDFVGWINIGGAIFAVLSFFMWMGILFGPLSKLPGQYEQILIKLTAMDKRMDQTDWAVEAMKSRVDAFTGQLLASADDRQKIRDMLRVVEAEASNLKATTLTREDMVEWMSALGARNKTLSIPTLIRGRTE